MLDQSCWTCGYQQIGGMTFLGLCRWFELAGQPKKEIPPRTVDVGCRKWEPRRPVDAPPLGDKIFLTAQNSLDPMLESASMAETLRDRVERMLIQSRAAHQRAREARARKQDEASRAELQTAYQLRQSAHALDPDHVMPAWADEVKPTHQEYLDFYERQLNR